MLSCLVCFCLFISLLFHIVCASLFAQVSCCLFFSMRNIFILLLTTHTVSICTSVYMHLACNLPGELNYLLFFLKFYTRADRDTAVSGTEYRKLNV